MNSYVRSLFIPGMILLSLMAAAQAQDHPLAPPGWKLVWSDEFNATDGSPVDSSKWVTETGGNGWGNQELEYYTARPQNSFQENGHLVIKAIRETYTGADAVARDYTSARLKTQGKY